MNAIILHGAPSKEEYYDPNLPTESNSHWLPWLQKQFVLADIPAATPEVPKAHDRNWQVWNREVERFDITPETILIGHSTGAGFFVKYLSIHPEITVKKLILVAPWLDPFQEHTKNFFDDFEIDPTLIERVGKITVFVSDDDQEDIHKTVEVLREKLPNATYRIFHNYGHFCYENMKTTHFPELRDEVLA